MRSFKYGNKKVEFEGIKFDSRKELRRYHQLKLLEKAGQISELTVHKRFQLILPSGKPIKIRGAKRMTTARYTPDFVYQQNGQTVFEDVKSIATMTEASKLRIAVFEAIFDAEVKIV